jgi:hypothetical protein
MPTQLEEEFTRARALMSALKTILESAADLDDCARTVGDAVFLASELEQAFDRVENLAADWKINGEKNDH